MGLFKADLYRFFTIGFAVGAALVVATTDGSALSAMADRVIPAEAQVEAQSTP